MQLCFREVFRDQKYPPMRSGREVVLFEHDLLEYLNPIQEHSRPVTSRKGKLAIRLVAVGWRGSGDSGVLEQFNQPPSDHRLIATPVSVEMTTAIGRVIERSCRGC